MESENKAKFNKIYANLPLGVRQEVVLVIDKEPISWNAAHVEIDADTPLSKIILEKLSQLEII